MIRKFQAFWQKHILGPVPVALEYCEYECRKDTCSRENWATCENRLKYARDLAEREAAKIGGDNSRH